MSGPSYLLSSYCRYILYSHRAYFVKLSGRWLRRDVAQPDAQQAVQGFLAGRDISPVCLDLNINLKSQDTSRVFSRRKESDEWMITDNFILNTKAGRC